MRFPRPLLTAAAALAVLALASCDSPTGSNQPVAARLDIVSGDLQTQTVAKELAQPLVVKVLDSKGKAVKQQIVNFVVTAGNGSVFAGSALTDDNGEARERWTLGTVAGDTQRVEARAVDPSTGAALVFATYRAVGTPDVPTSIAAAGTSAFTGLPLLPLADSVAAVVRDVYGNPVPGTAVVWTVKQGGGSVSPVNTTTGPAGVARTGWTLGAPLDSLQVIEAAAGLTIKTQFTANGHVPSDVVLVKVSGDAQTDTAGQVLPQPLVVRVQRANGTPVQGIPVTFTLPAGSGSVSPTTAVSNAAGQVSVQWTLGTGAGTKSATAGVANGATATFTATSLAGDAVTLQKVSGDLQSGRAGTVLADSVVVRALDTYGNPVAGTQVQWKVTAGGLSSAGASGDGRVLPLRNTTGADGRAAVAWTIGTSSIETLTVTSAGLAPLTFRTGIGSVYFTVLAPEPHAVVDDNVVVQARVDSSSASVASVTATAGGHSAALTPTGSGTVQGTLSLAGLPRGATDVRVTAVTTTGDSSVVVMPVFHDGPPVVTFTAPHMGTVARPSVRVDADCLDDSGNCQLKVTASTAFVGSGNPQTVLLTATNAIHQDVSLAAYDGKDVRLRIIATDSVGHSLEKQLEIPVESSANLTELLSAGDRLMDFDATYALVGDQRFSCCIGGQVLPWAVRLVDRGTGTAVALDSGSFMSPSIMSYEGWLHPNGALYVYAGAVADSRSGTVTNLSPPVQVAGGWAVYGTATRMEMATGATMAFAGDQPDVAANGDVAFQASGGISWYHGGTTAGIAASGQYPVTDGINVAYVDAANHAILYLGAGGTVDLGAVPSFDSHSPPAHRLVEVENGWTAWVKPDGGGVGQVWVRSPAGTVTQVTSGGQQAEIVTLGASGQVVYRAGGQVYVAQSPYTAAAVRVFGDHTGHGFVRWRGTDLVLFLGRTAFSVSY
ncbi:MAG TPA: hypothetical protein VJT67_06565 [Longimicrobiaceae bacterium]|nr:hypothetical protein [Longimicrobiaceae bacterium]